MEEGRREEGKEGGKEGRMDSSGLRQAMPVFQHFIVLC